MLQTIRRFCPWLCPCTHTHACACTHYCMHAHARTRACTNTTACRARSVLMSATGQSCVAGCFCMDLCHAGPCVYLCACCVAGKGFAIPNAPECAAGACGWVGGALLQRILSSSLSRKQASLSNPFPRGACSRKGLCSSVWAELLTLWERKGAGQRRPQGSRAWWWGQGSTGR